MFNKNLVLDFVANDKEFFDVARNDKQIEPHPSSWQTPTWLKNTSAYVNDKRAIDEYSDPTSTIKMCMPVQDILKAGYIIPLPCDVWVYNEGENKIKFQWSWDGINLISEQRKDQYSLYPVPDAYYNTAFSWTNHWIVKTPKNWSCIFSHPMHRDELPFKCMSSIVDTDKYPAPVNFPFFLRKDFQGLIPKGTPLMQVIPFKREKFKSRFSYDNGVLKTLWKKAHTSFFNRYADNFRTPKNFEQGDVKKCPFAFMHPKKD
jgi:hypothetical protein